MTRALTRWLPPVLWMGVIYWLSAQPDLPDAPGVWLDTILKKLAHVLSYGFLTWLYLRALRGRQTATDRLRLISVSVALIYALSDEWHQSFVPGRNPSPIDVFIDVMGASLAMALDRRRARLQDPTFR